MIQKCPGQDRRNLRVEVVDCPQCGYRVEIFSDEIKVKCPKCRQPVMRKRLPSCIDWCRFAKDCMR